MNIICIFFKVDKFTSQSVQHYWKRIEILFSYVNYSKHKCLWSFIFNYDSIWNPMFKRKVDFLRVNHDKLKPYDFLTYLNKLNNNWQCILTYQSWTICFRNVDTERKGNVKNAYVTKYSETETNQAGFHQLLER